MKVNKIRSKIIPFENEFQLAFHNGRFEECLRLKFLKIEILIKLVYFKAFHIEYPEDKMMGAAEIMEIVQKLERPVYLPDQDINYYNNLLNTRDKLVLDASRGYFNNRDIAFLTSLVNNLIKMNLNNLMMKDWIHVF